MSFIAAGPQGPPRNHGLTAWPRILPSDADLRADDAPGPALVRYRPGQRAGAVERFQTVYAVSLPFSFLWSYGLLRGAESLQGMGKEEGKAFEKKYLVLSAAAGSLVIAAVDRLWSRRRSRSLAKAAP